MASLEALSLASNIVQFVDYAGRLITSARAIYKSADQASAGQLSSTKYRRRPDPI
ncbi:hypothetical protein F5Y09DRAFT_320721, partial [Xylaria sp. FL1042]